MNFRTFNDLNTIITQNLYKIPRDIDIVAGIPRSGLFPANLISIYLNKPLADLDGLLEGRLLSAGQRLSANPHIPAKPNILLVDDSIHSGHALKVTKNKIANSSFIANWHSLAIFASNNSKNMVDTHFDICPQPRLFQWNWTHSNQLQHCCLDIDGVLCANPTEEQNDDGERYIDFILNAPPHYIPTTTIGSLVTSRLEKYRPQTEAWLKKHNIKYNHLIMLNLPDAETRRRLGIHAKHKSDNYKQLDNTFLFIESAASQANYIAQNTGKAVLCTDSNTFHPPTAYTQIKNSLKLTTIQTHSKLRSFKHRVKNKLIKIASQAA